MGRKEELYAVIGLFVAISSCVAAWLTVPQLQSVLDAAIAITITPMSSTDTRTPVPTKEPIPTSTPTLTQTLQEPYPQLTGKIAFTSEKAGSNDIYLLDLNTDDLTQLTDHPADDKFASISPDGKRIAFLSDRNGNDDIYLINIDGDNLVQLTSNPASEDLPIWSPDGQWILYSSDRDGDPDIFTIQVDTLEEIKLFDSPLRDGHPSLASDGRTVAYNSGEAGTKICDSWDIYSFEIGDDSSTRLTDNDVCDWAPNWSPDGQHLVFLSKQSDGSNADVYIMNGDGSGVIRLTTHPAYDWGAVWSYDGNWIAFTSDRNGGQDNIYISDLNGTEVRQITFDGGFYPSWGPSD